MTGVPDRRQLARLANGDNDLVRLLEKVFRLTRELDAAQVDARLSALEGGASGTFQQQGGGLVTVVDGIITDIGE